MFATIGLKLLLILLAQEYDAMRTSMVRNQIINRGITDKPLIEAFNEVPRHLFVPFEYQNYAYEDRPLPIGYNQTISQPYVVAYMTEQLNLSTTDKVLEIGTGSGYQAAILAEIVDEVYSIEIIAPLGQHAAQVLDSLGYTNVHCKIGDGYHGWAEHQPYDAIILTASPSTIPLPLIDQLKEGGRLIAPVESGGHQTLVLYTKKNGQLKTKKLLAVRFVPFTRSHP
ncbi:protein-L-isoaspartate(D-aspartate) O-methyltransferase [Carboxylicivirga taeanensis]|uniref:protein-L-isoaspartate(D-aspartate) O-methyltransferase n=1 Tax=Carboxylicivirga taeanensis TaxID=1416875 RepID=UPI003F6DECB1